jgi:hypothetical protein
MRINSTYLSWYCRTTMLLCYFAVVGAMLHTTNGRAVIALVALAMLTALVDDSTAVRLISAAGNTLSLIGFYLLGIAHQGGWICIGLGGALLTLPAFILIGRRVREPSVEGNSAGTRRAD